MSGDCKRFCSPRFEPGPGVPQGYLPDGRNAATASYLYFSVEGRGTHQTTRRVSLPFSEAQAFYNIYIANCNDPILRPAICFS